MQHFIEHIVEPQKLLLAWQTIEGTDRTRYIVGELYELENGRIGLRYLNNTQDFQEARSKGFTGHPAFQDLEKTYEDVVDAFMRRVPPRTRGDFTQYLEGLRLEPHVKLSDFALLGYSGAKLPTDGFSLIHPFSNVQGKCELLIEAAGFRHSNEIDYDAINIGDPVNFLKGSSPVVNEIAIEMKIDSKLLGYVNRGLVPTLNQWLDDHRILSAWVEKKNGVPEKPSIYVFVQVDGN